MAGASFKTALGSAFNNASGTTLAITTTAAIAVDDLVVVRWASDNLSATTPTATCADGGNTYTMLRQAAVNATAAAGVAGGLLATRATVARPSGSTITLTFSGAITGKAAYAESFVGVYNSTRVTAVGTTAASGTAASSGASAAGLVAGDLCLGFSAVQTRGTSTGDADTTNGTWSTKVTVNGGGTSGQDGTSVQINGQYKVVTATGAQTYDNTVTSTYWVTGLIVLQVIPDPAITQAAYQFFDDAGTEAGAASLAAANTAIIGNLANGDGYGALRVRLQSTNANPMSATDDWQLQWEKNASGSWTNVSSGGAEGLTDGYAETNRDDAGWLNTAATLGMAQSFIGDGRRLSRCRFWLAKTGSPTSTITAALYDHTGTYGNATSQPTNGSAALAVSTTSVSASTLTTSYAWYSFDFDQTFLMLPGVPYFIEVLYSGNSTNYVMVGLDGSSPAHSGASASQASTGNWGHANIGDYIFEVYSRPATSTVVPYNNTNLTDGAATTNRLGAGTGSFVAGKVSETGDVPDFSWTANSYTELLYSLKLIAADLADADTLRFRVLRNGVTTVMTYTQTPTITIKGPTPLVASVAGVATNSAALGVGRGLTASSTAVSTTTADLTVTAPAGGGLGPNSTPNAVGWWDGADAASVTTSGGEVTRWADKSGLSRHLDRYTVGYGPSYTANVLNGLAVVQFFAPGSAAGDFLVNMAGNQITGNTCSLFVVCRVISTANYGRIVSLRTSAGTGYDWDNDQGFGLAQDPNLPSVPSVTRNYSAYGGPCLENPGQILNTWMLVSVVFDGTSGTLYVNGTSVDTVTGTWGVFDIDHISLGSDHLGDGGITMDVAEVVVYSDAKVGTARTDIESYLTTKWLGAPAGGPVALSGSSAGAGTNTSALARATPLAATVAGAATDTSALAVTRTLQATVAGTATVTATTMVSVVGLSATGVAGTSTDTAALTVTTGPLALAGSVAGASTVTGTLVASRGLQASVPGTGTDTAALALALPLAAASVLGTSTAVATTIVVARSLVATVPGTSTDTAALAVARPLVASVASVASVTGAVIANVGLAATSTSLASTTATLTVTSPTGPIPLSGLAMWLDANALGLADGADVPTWTDTSSAHQTCVLKGSPAPKIRANALSGLPVVRFKVDEGRFRWTGTNVTTSWTIVLLARQYGPNGGRVIDAAYPPSNLLFGWWNYFQDVCYHEGFTLPDMKTAQTTDWKLYSADGITATPLTRFFRNDAGVSTLLGTTTTGAGFNGSFAISGYDPDANQETSDCEVAEVVLYDRVLSDVERGQVEDYLRTKWLFGPVGGGPVALTGSADGIATSNGTLYKSLTLTTSVSGSASDSGVLAVARALGASSAGVSTNTAALAGAKPLGASSAGVSTDTAAVVLGRPLASTTAGLSAPSGALQMAWGLQASSAGGTTTFANLSTTGFGGFVAGTSTVTGSLAVTHTLSASSAGAGTSTATVQRAMLLSSLAAGISTVTVVLSKLVGLTGSAQGLGTGDASARMALTLVGTAVSATVVPTTVLKVDPSSQARSTGAATARGTLVILTSSPVKVWDGTKYTIAFLKVWDGVTWVDGATAVYSGSVFVPNS